MRLRFAVFSFSVALLAGCGKSEPTNPSSPSATAPAQPFANASISEIGKQRWARTCAMCHVRGEGGAPKIGDTSAWAARLAQGEDVVLQHAIDGFNNMPPLGYCMDCEREDLRAYIRFMASGGGA
jgi:cytochrome c5